MSLAYMVMSQGSTPYFTGTDTAATATTLAEVAAALSGIQIFFLFHLILIITIPSLAVSWYALLNPHSKKPENAKSNTRPSDQDATGDDGEGTRKLNRDKKGGWIRKVLCCGLWDKLGPRWVKWVVGVTVLLLILVLVLWLVKKGQTST
jgi:hypothetical protein